jgi:hypothetical protein
VVVGNGRAWSLIEWQRAAEMWRLHGKEYGLTLTDRQLANLRQQANDTSLPTEPTQEQLNDPAMRQRYEARNRAREALQFYTSFRQTTNFPYFLHSAEAEEKRPTVIARKTLWLADQARKSADFGRAIALYKQGLEQWKQVLTDNPDFHRLPPPDHSDRVEEETFEFELSYFRLLVQHDERVRERANQLARAAHGVVPFLTIPFPSGGVATRDPLWPDANRENIKWYVVENTSEKDFTSIKDEKERKMADFSSPFVGSLTPRGEPWVRAAVMESVRTKQGVSRGTTKAPTPPPGGPIRPAGPPLPPGAPGGG